MFIYESDTSAAGTGNICFGGHKNTKGLIRTNETLPKYGPEVLERIADDVAMGRKSQW
jgi:hypothetical protein